VPGRQEGEDGVDFFRARILPNPCFFAWACNSVPSTAAARASVAGIRLVSAEAGDGAPQPLLRSLQVALFEVELPQHQFGIRHLEPLRGSAWPRAQDGLE
jgi:hypothetical protein